jgi:signal transduction histidine kinase
LLPDVAMEEGLRATVGELGVRLRDASSRATFELALLQAELGEDKVDAEGAVQRLSLMDATMMDALQTVPDVIDQLEKSAERDEQFEPAFVLVIEAAGVMLQALEKARAATLRIS